jgi:hypothetical protein
MNSSVKASSVRFDEDSMWVELSDGRTLGVPLAWFPRLLHGTPAQREQVTTSSRGLHWEELDEDVSIAGLLAGRGDQTRALGDVASERTVTMDQSDPDPGRVDRTRMGRRNPADTEPRPPISAEDIEATRTELAELRRRMTRRTA